ncbi:MAG: leucine-rich repeat domain-containing protein [Promethearchaeota archaeon]
MKDEAYLISEIEKIISKPLRHLENDEHADWKPEAVKFENNRVVELSLYKCGLQDVPHQIRKFKNLRKLFLVRNELKIIPEWINELQNLEILDLYDNKIEKLPDSICGLANLKFLTLNKNKLKELPRCIGNLDLRILRILDNPLERLPVSMRKWADLYSNFKKLHVRKYGWTGSSRDTLNLLIERRKVKFENEQL